MWNKEIFIEKAKQLYGDKYDYSKVEYKNSNSKVCIICPEHGEFYVSPGNHIYGKCACQECKLIEKGRKFIERAKQIHGDRYDYSKVKYVSDKTRVCIICPEHGEFWQTPSLHILQKCGCPKCAGKNKTLAEYIEKSKEIHGDKYDYSLVDKCNSRQKITLKCNNCGNIFQTTFDRHIHLKNGCPKCSHRSYKYTIEEFLERAKQVHGDRYDYSKVDYKSSREKVCIICPEHGEFWQTPYKHINAKQGCPLCSKFHKMTKEEFIEKAIKVHGNRFDYSKVEYINDSTKVCIICPEHGEFWQAPHGHLSGKGCSMCHEENHVNEMLLYKFIKESLPNYTIINQYKDNFLNGQVLDIFIKELNIAIEYQGIQHFKPVKYFGGEEKYIYTVKMDKLKREKCINNGIKLFYFSLEKNYPKEYLDTIYRNKDELLIEIKKLCK